MSLPALRQRVEIDGTVDSSPIYLRAATVRGRRRDVFIVTTSYGRTIAVDANTGAILWRFTPPGYDSWAGSSRITNASPVADPDRTFVYTASPGGRIHKIVLSTGREVTSGGWPAAITRDPGHEKIGPALKLRLLRLGRLNGRPGEAGPVTGGELQTLPTPGGGLHSAPAVWRSGAVTWLFVSTFSSTAGYRLRDGRLDRVWQNGNAGTSPVVAGGLLYVYDPGGGLRVYRPASEKLVAILPAGGGHWNSPIVTDGRIALPEGNANEHQTSGVLDIYRLP